VLSLLVNEFEQPDHHKKEEVDLIWKKSRLGNGRFLSGKLRAPIELCYGSGQEQWWEFCCPCWQTTEGGCVPHSISIPSKELSPYFGGLNCGNF
jgi:hypothetical protein